MTSYQVAERLEQLYEQHKLNVRIIFSSRNIIEGFEDPRDESIDLETAQKALSSSEKEYENNIQESRTFLDEHIGVIQEMALREARDAELLELSERYRYRETIGCWAGAAVCAMGFVTLGIITGEVAKNGGQEISNIAAGLDTMLLYSGFGSLSLSSRYGRQADVIDSELLRGAMINVGSTRHIENL